jgi:hypothetical protein
MAPLGSFPSNPYQQMNAGGPCPPGRGRLYPGDASRIPPNVPAQMPQYPGAMPPMRAQQQYPANHGPLRAMPPYPPMGGPMNHMPQGKRQPGVSHGPPPTRLPHYSAVDRPHHLQMPPDMRGRMSFPSPHMHRPMPPPHHNSAGMHGMHRGMPMPYMRGPQGPMHAQIGRPRMPPHIPMSSQEPRSPQQGSAQIPLRELQTQNISDDPLPTTYKLSTITSQAQDAAADAAEILLGLRAIPSPPPPPEEKKAVRQETPSLESLPDDPISLPSRLSVPEDESKLNSMHCFLRSDLLELFVVERSKSPKSATEDPSYDERLSKQGFKVGSASGRVGLRCVHCAKARARNASSEGEAPMAVFYPKSISELYRLVTSWQRVHLRKCRNLPPSVRETYDKTRQDRSRGKTQWWVTSAEQIGLVDCTSKAGGIRFAVAPNGLTI